MRVDWLLCLDCGNNNTPKVVAKLVKERDVDLTYERGLCFVLAVQHVNVVMLNALLNYYTETQLVNCVESERIERKEKLRDLLDGVVDSVPNISDEILQILQPHRDYDPDQDLEGCDDLDSGSVCSNDDVHPIAEASHHSDPDS